MLPPRFIEKKRNGEAPPDEDLSLFIGGYGQGAIPGYQMAALEMAEPVAAWPLVLERL